MYSKRSHKQNERQPTAWEKIFTSEAVNMGLISKLHKVLLIAQYQRNEQPMQMVKDLNRDFSKEDREMAKRHMIRWSTLLIIREMQITTTVRYYLVIEWPSSKNLQTTNAIEGMEKREHFYTVGGKVNAP